jgi:hypothetical protein
LYQLTECDDQIAAHSATDITIVHFDDLFIAVLNQNFIVDIFLAEFIFDHGDFIAVVFLQYAIEQGRFSRAQKAGKNSG